MVPIQGFAPDADPTTPGIFTDCSNVVPFEAGFRGAPTGQPTTAAALAAACNGAVVATRLDGTRRVFAGTTTNLYELSGTTWTSRTRTVGGAYTGGTDTRWSFCQFGDTTLAANLSDTIQGSSSGAFADIATAPKAKIIVSATNNFVVAFNTVDGTYGVSPDRWWCCAQANQNDWTPSVSTLATTGRLVATEGQIQAALPLGNYVVAYKARGVYLGSFVGAPVVWQWDLIPGGEAGCVGQEAVCDIGGAHFIVGTDNFWFFDGTRPVPVGDGIVRQWFFNNSNATFRYRTKCVYDKQNKVVRIHYPSLNGGGSVDSCLVVHVVKQPFRFGRSDFTVQAPLFFIANGTTVDGMNSFGATVDALPNIPVDSQYWQAGGQSAAYFDTTNTLRTLNGACDTSSFTTGDFGDDDQVTMISRFRVRFSQSPTSASATGFFKFNAGDSLRSGPTGSINDGKFDVRQSGRFHRIRVDMTGDHKEVAYSSADEMTLRPAGMR